MKLSDGKRTVEIRMVVWEGTGYSPDLSADFFEAPYDKEKEAYIVKDVDYCIEQAQDWKNSEGDFRDNMPNENNMVFVEEL